MYVCKRLVERSKYLKQINSTNTLTQRDIAYNKQGQKVEHGRTEKQIQLGHGGQRET